jgi:transcriptional regulator with XRE-family HTH domain
MRLKELRMEKGMTQQEVADALGISQVTYSRYEKGEREPTLEMLVALSSFFDVSVDYLLDVTPSETRAKDLDEFTAFRKRRIANPEYDKLMKKAEKSSPNSIKAAIAVLDALDPFA